ncbi:MAG: Nitrilase/cyanide hydratase and apolipoprotein N-acyltransferase [Acidimicrobiaceae bacterium]|nr:Nitrilase/cyanide hydratase and apolipoprotein N-acyltransferase [Acidimicrobiaceae bacterium]
MKIALVQADLTFEDREANLPRYRKLAKRAAAEGARLVLFPEMFATGFSMAPERTAEPASGPTVEFLGEQAASLGVYLAGSMPFDRGDGGRATNRFVCAAPDGSLTTYDKIHPFSYGGEDLHYAAGDQRTTFQIDGVRLTPFICYDLRFADAFWVEAERTDCYLVVANWPAARQEHWSTLLRARAIENQAYVVGVNRVGEGGGISYAGGSAVIGPFGEVVAEAGSEEQLVLAEVEPGRVAEVRARYPFLVDRSPQRTEEAAVRAVQALG